MSPVGLEFVVLKFSFEIQVVDINFYVWTFLIFKNATYHVLINCLTIYVIEQHDIAMIESDVSDDNDLFMINIGILTHILYFLI